MKSEAIGAWLLTEQQGFDGRTIADVRAKVNQPSLSVVVLPSFRHAGLSNLARRRAQDALGFNPHPVRQAALHGRSFSGISPLCEDLANVSSALSWNATRMVIMSPVFQSYLAATPRRVRSTS